MELDKRITVIVPEQKGINALAGLSGVRAVLVAPDQSIPDSAKDAEILVVGPAEQQSEVNDALHQIEQLPHLKLLQTLGQGVEQWVGKLPEGLKVSTARGAHGGSTAEWAVAALLSLVRELPHYMENQKSHTWESSRTRTLLTSKILIYGLSDLGTNMQSRLQAFGATITMVGTHSRDGVVDQATAKAMLPSTDVVMLALPLTPKTKNIVDADFLAALPNGAIIINAGRGGLVDQAALMKELESNRLRAALDVTTPEPLPSDNPIWNVPGLLITPHVGGNTDGADDRAWHIATKQIRDYLNGNLSI